MRNGKKVGKESARQLFGNLTQEEREEIIFAAGNYAQSKTAQDGYAKDPERFLKKKFWKDWIEPEAPPTPPPPAQKPKPITFEDAMKREMEERGMV